MIMNMEEMLKKAQSGKYAVPQFNVNNLEWAKFILEECEAHKSPVILGISEGAIKYMGGYKTVANMLKALIADLKITIPTPKTTKTTSDTDTYSCNYVNNIANLIYPVGSIYISVNYR